MSALELKVYDILKAQFGDQEARSVLDYIDERTAKQFNNYKAELATRSDIADLKEEIVQVRIELKEGMAQVKAELKEDIGHLRTEFKEEIGQVRMEFKDEIAQVKTELKEEIVQVKTEFKDEITRVKIDIKEGVFREIAQVRVEMMASKADIIKWMFIFWVGQFAVMLALFKFFR